MRNAMCILILLALTAVAAGQAQEDRRNAATWYNRAYERYQSAAITQAEWEAIWAFDENPSQGPSPMARLALQRLQPALNLTRRGAYQGYSDFGLDYSQGPLGNRDHLNHTRGLVKLMRSDFLLRLQDGDSYGAVDRLSTIYRMARHAGEDEIMISSLVGAAYLSFGDKQIEFALDRAAISPLDAGTLSKALDQFDSDDPFNLRAAVANEGKFTIQWLRDQFRGDENLQQPAEEIWDSLVGDDKEKKDQLGRLTPQELEQAIGSCEKVQERVNAAFAERDPEKAKAALAKIDEEIKRGDHGPLAPLLLGSVYASSYESISKSQKQLRDRAAMLKDIASGEVNPMSLANAAVWYLRAVQAIEKFDPVKFEEIRRYTADHTAAADAKLVEILDEPEAQAIIDTLRQAAQIERCDFSDAKPAWPTLLWRYHPGLRDAVRLLVADAARRLHGTRSADDIAAAAQRLAIGYRLCAHLAPDKSVPSSLVAHAGFNSIDALVEAATNGELFTAPQKADLWKSLRFRTADPFGYEAALAAQREQIKTLLWQRLKTDDPELIKRADSFVADSSPERLLWLQTIFDEGYSGYARQANQRVDQHLAHLDDVVDAEAFHDSIAQSEIVLAMIAKGQFESLAGVDHPVISKITQRRGDAFTDLRRCQARLKAEGVTR